MLEHEYLDPSDMAFYAQDDSRSRIVAPTEKLEMRRSIANVSKGWYMISNQNWSQIE